MKITDVRISLKDDEKLKAFATVTLEGCFVVRGMKVIRGVDRLFVAMPARRKPDGKYQDVAHPINSEFRRMIEERVLGEYEKALESGRQPDIDPEAF